MAARRISKSAIDWAAFAERIPESQKVLFQAFKSKSDAYLSKALSYPEKPPAIDWAFYRSKISPAMVEQFDKQFSALNIPYPSENVSPEIDAQHRESEKVAAQFVKDSDVRIEQYKKELARWDDVIPFDQMTLDDFAEAFPELAFDPINNPTHWPHGPEERAKDEDDDKKEAAVAAHH